MLTAEQKAIRATGLGASEIAAVAGISPWASPLDIWLRKATPTRGPLIEDDLDAAAQDRTEVGHVLEEPVLDLYRRRTGFAAVRHSDQTRRHPQYRWMLASPDATADAGHLVEIKVVGMRMAEHWDGGVPDYVRAQAQQQMLVAGATRCDVAALIGGTDFRPYVLEHDAALAAALIGVGESFWRDHVEADIPPPPGATEDRMEYLAKRFPRHRDALLEVPAEHHDLVGAMIARYTAAAAAAKAADGALEAAKAALCELIGEAAGIRGPWGQATWKLQAGRPAYEKIATALAPHGLIPADLLEQHRGRPFRKFHYSAPKGR